MNAETLSCRSCGAPVDPRASACAACGSPFLMMACEGCGRPIVFGVHECPDCKAAAPKRLTSTPTEHPCPACEGRLHKPPQVPVELEHCILCGGLWVESDLFISLCLEASDVSGRPLPELKGSGQGKPNAAFYRSCPECAKSMNRTQFAPGAGLILDTCRDHGVWMDGGEWARIASYLRQGGLRRVGEQPGPYLTRRFGRMNSKAWGAMAHDLAKAEGPKPVADPLRAWSPWSSARTNDSLGWLLLDVLTTALDVITDD